MQFIQALASVTVAKFVDLVVVPVGSQTSYLINYKENIKNLKKEVEELEYRKQGVQGKVEADRRNGQQIVPHVENWFCKVDTMMEELQELCKIEVNKKEWCLDPNLMSRYSLSRRAKKKVADVVKLKEEIFDIISYPTRPLRLADTFTLGVKSFASRLSIMADVIDKLKDDDFKRIGICGMGGVGKTTLAKEVIRIVEANKLFIEVVMAVVSQTPDYWKIQGEIADILGLKFDAETIRGRAGQLLKRLQEIDKVLIVLDDVWTELDFESIGLPSNNGCKIIFTSRSENVCLTMGSQWNFIVSILYRDEAWEFFREMAGADVVDKPDIHGIAKEIANECGGLPIAIATIGKVLANREKHVWDDALVQLRKSSVLSFSGMHECVYSRIELSYKFIGNEDAKSCLLLCSLFPEDFDIPIEVLLRHGIALRMFEDIDALWELRNRVHTMVGELKRCFLLLDSKEEECVKMHDVVRDAILSIAFEGDTWDCNSAIWVMLDEMRKENPSSFECQKVKILEVASKKRELLPEKLFQGMSKLMILSLRNSSLLSMSSMFKALGNLHSLRLEYCQLKDVSIIGKQMRKLEILSFAHSNIKELPKAIGRLGLLRLLDLTDCNYLIKISCKVLSSLSRLEELYLRVKNFPWEENGDILIELKSISHKLKVFEIRLDLDDLIKDFDLRNIVRFWIYIRNSYDHLSYPDLVRGGYLHPNILKLNADYNFIQESMAIKLLIKKSNNLSLEGVAFLQDVVGELDEEGLPYLKNLRIVSCNYLKYLADATYCISFNAFPLLQSLHLCDLCGLEDIFHVPSQMVDISHGQGFTSCQCFGSLRELTITLCGNLKSVFSIFPRRTLAKLQYLHVSACDRIECISSNKIEPLVVYSNLEELSLEKLQSFVGFSKCTVPNEKHQSMPQVSIL